MVAACAEMGIPNVSAATTGKIHLGIMGGPLFQFSGDVFGMLLMALENLQAGLQQAFQLGVVRGWNKRGLQRAIDRLVIGDFVGDIGLVEFRALQLAEFGEFGGGVLRQGLAGVVVFRRDVKFLDQIERLLVHGLVVAHHVFRECLDVLVAGFGQCLLGGRDIDRTGGVGN